MIGINIDDQDFLRFLWLESPYDPNSEVMHYRFTRFVLKLKPSPVVLGVVIAKHIYRYQDRYPKMAHVIQNSVYMDDLETGADSDEEAFELYLTAKRLMSE